MSQNAPSSARKRDVKPRLHQALHQQPKGQCTGHCTMQCTRRVVHRSDVAVGGSGVSSSGHPSRTGSGRQHRRHRPFPTARPPRRLDNHRQARPFDCSTNDCTKASRNVRHRLATSAGADVATASPFPEISDRHDTAAASQLDGPATQAAADRRFRRQAEGASLCLTFECEVVHYAFISQLVLDRRRLSEHPSCSASFRSTGTGVGVVQQRVES